MIQQSDFFGGATKRYYSDIGEVVSFTPRFQTSGAGGFRNQYFPRRRLGFGWGSTILSFFKPILKKGLHSIVDFASKVATDAIQGENVKESLKKHGLSTVSNLLQTKPPENQIVSQNVDQFESTKQKKRVSPAIVARRKQKTSVTKRGSGVKKKKKIVIKKPKLKLTKKFPILDFM